MYSNFIDALERMNIKVTSEIEIEPEGREYKACRLKLNGHNIVFRSANLTPKKQGLFVTLWKRTSKNGKIEPLDMGDDFTFVIIEARQEDYYGFFIFNRDILIKNKIIVHKGQGADYTTKIFRS